MRGSIHHLMPYAAVRIFDLEDGEEIPVHKHDWDHWTLIAHGSARVTGDGEHAGKTLAAGTETKMVKTETHGFIAIGSTVLVNVTRLKDMVVDDDN